MAKGDGAFCLLQGRQHLHQALGAAPKGAGCTTVLHSGYTTLPQLAEHDSATACCRVRNTSTKHWTPEEDKLLTQLVLKHGAQAWSFIASHFDGRHPGKSCRLRWLNQLDPGVNREPFSEWEDAVIVRGAEVSSQMSSIVVA